MPGKMIGGDGTPAVRGFGLELLAEAPGFELADVRAIGDDVLSQWVRRQG